MRTVVVFRVWKDRPGGVLALFPELPSDYAGLLCESYEHVGQHGGADYAGCIARTRPARPDEYTDLAHELTGRGYDLRPIRRASHHHHARRYIAAANCREKS